MTSDILLISTAVTLVVLSVILVTLFAQFNRHLTDLGLMLRDLRREMAPVISEVRLISLNVADASESLRTGMRRVNRLTEAIGNIGDDLEAGRRTVKGGIKTLAFLTLPWMSKLDVLRRNLFERIAGAAEARDRRG